MSTHGGTACGQSLHRAEPSLLVLTKGMRVSLGEANQLPRRAGSGLRHMAPWEMASPTGNQVPLPLFDPTILLSRLNKACTVSLCISSSWLKAAHKHSRVWAIRAMHTEKLGIFSSSESREAEQPGMFTSWHGLGWDLNLG